MVQVRELEVSLEQAKLEADQLRAHLREAEAR
jgi:hypothetical protein